FFFAGTGGGTGWRFTAGTGAAGAGAFGGGGVGAAAFGAGAGGAEPGLKASITLVPPPLAVPLASSVGSNTACTSPNRTMTPGDNGDSPWTFSPSTKVPFVESRSTSIHTPSRRCSFACDVETDASARTRSL